MAVGNVALANQLDWVKPEGWIDISSVGDNEINILVGEGSMGLSVNLSAGTYTIDWGDGTIETGRASGTQYGHTYDYGTGTPTPYGYTCRKIRIYNAGGTITRFVPASQPDQGGTSTQSRGLPMLWLVLGTNGLTSAQYLAGVNNVNYPSQLQCVQLPPIISGITNWSQAFYNAGSLQKVIGLDSPWGLVTDISGMFELCWSIQRIDFPKEFPVSAGFNNFSGVFSGCNALRVLNIPSVWPSTITNYASMFNGCGSLKSITLPSVWGTGGQLFNQMFANCYSLQSITLPAAGFPNTTTTVQQMFQNCWSLSKVDLGSNWGTTGVIATQMFAACRNLQEIIFPSNMANFTAATTMLTGIAPSTALLQRVSNLDKIGSLTNSIDFTTFCNSIYYTGGTINSLLTRIQWNAGSSTTKIGLTTLRLTNTGSLFTGASPQVNVSYTRMETGSLNTLFGDLSTTGSVKAINITGANGTTGNTTNSFSFTSGSNIVNTTSGNVILPGYELTTSNTGTPPMNWIAVTPTIATDKLVPTDAGPNNVPNGKVGYFTSTPGSWAVVYKPYYVVNSDGTGFQISLTPGGTPIDISGSTVLTTFAYCANVVSYSGFSMVMDTVARSTTSVSSTVSPLQRITALSKGWTVTG